MSTTVVIPTKNEVIGVRKILPQIKKEWADEWIVVDGNSNDGTIEAAEKLDFKVIQQKGIGAANAEREGIEHSHSENVLFFHPDGNFKIEYILKLIKKIMDKSWLYITLYGF